MNSPVRVPRPVPESPSASSVRPGQRWINHARPELGLGMVVAAEGRTVTLRFGDQSRDHIFALESAPLSRIRFTAGDVVRTDDGARLAIDGVIEREGIYVYSGTDIDGSRVEIVETLIAADQSFNRPAERLLHGHIDDDRWFSLRHRTLAERHRLLADPLWGLLGGRTALLRHQLYVAHEVSRRHAPRVLLADEVGLGKTIEAGLVAHRQLLGEQVRRVLVVVPETLVHQWLVEMLRRFNLAFSVFDADRCDAMQSADGDAEVDDEDHRNPFLEEQLVLVSREFLADDASRLAQCRDASFDLLIVDEAHHLEPGESAVGRAYHMVESLAEVIPGVLLLTGTPHQLGTAGHVARLRLLDPHRYRDAGVLETEQREFEPVADLVDALLGEVPLDDEQQGALRDRGVVDDLDDDWVSDREKRDRVIDRLLDRFGTGRVMFRNTREAMNAFPPRRVFAHDLGASPFASVATDDTIDELLYPERGFIEREGIDRWSNVDPRVKWLEEWLAIHPGERALVICSSRDVAAALNETLKQRTGIRGAAFHEGLSLLERDRAAAWFADDTDNCQVLVCSEIGSEGRNFQFARHLVLFDLPLSPDLLEQRIGRLDRIGRRDDVMIQVPLMSGVPARLYRWFHEGLDAFEHNGNVNEIVFESLESRLPEALVAGGESLDRIIDETRALRRQLVERMQAGRDRLLESHSCRPGQADRLVETARQTDQENSVRSFVEQAAACYDIAVDPYRGNSVLLVPGERLLTPIPGLPERGLAATFDRNTALENEDLAFLTWEHPLVTAIADLVLNTERGNASICGIRHAALPRGRLAVQCVFVIEAPVFSYPQLTQYLPPMLVVHIYDENGSRLDPELDHETISSRWVPLKYKAARQIVGLKREALRDLLGVAGNDVNERAHMLLRGHGRAGVERLEDELSRLRHLAEVNPAVRRDEIEQLTRLVDAARSSLSQPRVRLDAVRVLVGL